MTRTYLIITLLLFALPGRSQDSLPSFKVSINGNTVVVSWLKPHLDITELVIQRSLDSNKGFRSIVSMPDPNAISNGYVDRTPNAFRYYYRIFYVIDESRYFFTAAQKATGDFFVLANKKNMDQQSNLSPILTFSTSRQIENGKKLQTPTYFAMQVNEIELPDNIENTVPEDIFTPSALIYTNREGNLIIALPEAEKKKYMLSVYLEEGTLLFNMKHIREPHLLVDRSNFFHSGWFRYDLYDGGRIQEKGRFFIPPEIQ